MSALVKDLPCATPGCADTIEVEVWEGWEDDHEGAYKRILLNTVHCDKHAAEAVAAGEEEERQKKRRLYADALRHSYIPKPWHGKGWEDYDLEEPADVVVFDKATNAEKLIATAEDASQMRAAAVAAARRWAEGSILGLVLAGPVGLGKTRLAGIAAQALIYRRIKGLSGTSLDRSVMPVRWVSVPDLIHKSKGDFGSDRRREAEKIITGAGAIVLDDIDKVKPTEVALDLLFEAIESRTNNGAQLLVTTNMRYPELVQLLGDPIASRIAGYCEGVRMVGEDRRTF